MVISEGRELRGDEGVAAPVLNDSGISLTEGFEKSIKIDLMPGKADSPFHSLRVLRVRQHQSPFRVSMETARRRTFEPEG